MPGYRERTPWRAFAHARGVPGDKLVTRNEKTKAAALDAAVYLMSDPYYQRPEGRVGIHKGTGPITVWTFRSGKWTPSRPHPRTLAMGSASSFQAATEKASRVLA